MSTDTAVRQQRVSTQARTTMVAGGAIVAVLGLLAMLFPFVTGVSLSVLFGALLVVGSIVHVAEAFSATGWRGFVFQSILGIVYALGGIALIANPVVGLATFTVLLVAFLLAEGVVQIAMGLRLRSQPRWFTLVASGVTSLAVAALIWANFPSSAAWAVGFLFGVNLLVTGVTTIFVAQRFDTSEIADKLRTPPEERLMTDDVDEM